MPRPAVHAARFSLTDTFVLTVCESKPRLSCDPRRESDALPRLAKGITRNQVHANGRETGGCSATCSGGSRRCLYRDGSGHSSETAAVAGCRRAATERCRWRPAWSVPTRPLNGLQGRESETQVGVECERSTTARVRRSHGSDAMIVVKAPPVLGYCCGRKTIKAEGADLNGQTL